MGCEVLGEIGVDVVANVRERVIATAHVTDRLAGDAAVVVDIDLSILGQPPATYDKSDRNVRKEYWWVSRRIPSFADPRIWSDSRSIFEVSRQ